MWEYVCVKSVLLKGFFVESVVINKRTKSNEKSMKLGRGKKWKCKRTRQKWEKEERPKDRIHIWKEKKESETHNVSPARPQPAAVTLRLSVCLSVPSSLISNQKKKTISKNRIHSKQEKEVESELLEL